MSNDPIGAALAADAEEARAEIRAAGIVCPSCGVNTADTPAGHVLVLSNDFAYGECGDGHRVALGEADFEIVKAAANVALLDAFRKRETEAFSRIIGKRAPDHEFTGLLGAPGEQP